MGSVYEIVGRFAVWAVMGIFFGDMDVAFRQVTRSEESQPKQIDRAGRHFLARDDLSRRSFVADVVSLVRRCKVSRVSAH